MAHSTLIPINPALFAARNEYRRELATMTESELEREVDLQIWWLEQRTCETHEEERELRWKIYEAEVWLDAAR